MAIAPTLPSPFCGLFHVTTHGQRRPHSSPYGQTIPNNGSGGGLKYGINTWFVANSAATPRSYHCPSTIFQTHPLSVRRPPRATLSFEAIRSKVHMAQLLTLQISTTPAPATTKMTWKESCMTSLMSSPQRKQKDENATQGKPKTPRHPSRLRPAQLRQLLSLLALLTAHLSIVISSMLRINSSRPSSSTGSSKHLFLAHQHITYLPYLCYLDICPAPPCVNITYTIRHSSGPFPLRACYHN
jgi:hypothetical protein